MKTISFIIISIGKSDKLDNLLCFFDKFVKFGTIILVDNSTSGILYNKYHNVKYKHEIKQGASYARNSGASIATSDYLYFLDDDILPNSSWIDELTSFLQSELFVGIIGGQVDIPKEIEKLVPNNYSYLVGRKTFGEKTKVIRRDYIGGCNFLITKKLFDVVGGMNVQLGHNLNKIVLNEDVYLQEKVRKNGKKIVFNPRLSVTHFWKGNAEQLIERVKLQGKYDKIVDFEIKRKRYILRIVKYSIYIFFFNIIMKYFVKTHNTNYYFTIVRYKGYAEYKIKK